jgi:Predicted membrane protein
MSLISEALKKAQRRQHEQQAAAAGESTDAPLRRRNPPAKGPLFLLIGAGAVALVVLSVVITVVFLNRTPEPASPAPIAAASIPTPAAQIEAPPPVIVAPALPQTASPTETEPPAITLEPEPSPEITTPLAVAPETPEPVPTTPSVAEPAAPSTAQVQALVDALRVTGIRSSGADSRVLMNERVYRVNDVVDRASGLKLVRVETDRLVFLDASGVTYEKVF